MKITSERIPLLSALGIALALCGSDGLAAEKYAVLVGVEAYNDFETLEYAEDDAEDIGQALEELGFKTTVMSSSARKSFLKPTSPEKILTVLKTRIDSCENGDTLIVGLSGHGIQFKDEEPLKSGVRETYFCPEDADTADKSTLLPINEQIIRMLNDCPASRKLLLVDACRNEILPESARKKGSVVRIDLEPVHQNRRSVPGGMAVLFSCDNGQFSWEHEELGHSVFSHFALQYLNGKADPAFYDGGLDVDNFVAFVRKRTNNYVFENNLSPNGQSPIRLGSGANWKISSIVELDDYSKASIEIIQRHAQQGIAAAQCELGVGYANGEIIAKNEELAIEWLAKAADQNSGDALYNLGLCKEVGIGGPVDQAGAFAMHLRAANVGHAKAQKEAGARYVEGVGVAKNEAEGFRWLKKSAENGSASGALNLGHCYLNGLGCRADNAAALAAYKKSAERGLTEGIWEVGQAYAFGNIVKRDIDEAFKWYRKGAELGHAGSQYQIGEQARQNGDLVEAARWFRKSADQGYRWAELAMGYAYRYGNGVDKNGERAIGWFEKAATQGLSEAQLNLGQIYYKSDLAPRDYNTAFYWYKQAAEAGDVTGMSTVGTFYKLGWGVAKDYQEARKWCLRAINGNENNPAAADAMTSMGGFYFLGNGVPVNYQEAAKWFRMGAKLGDGNSQATLGHFYEKGLGVPRDLNKARQFYRDAIKSGNIMDADRRLREIGG